MSGEATRQMEIARALAGGGCLTTAEIAEATGIDRRDVAVFTGRLVVRSWIVRREIGCFALSDVGRQGLESGEVLVSGPTGPRTGALQRPKRRTGRDRMWSAMRIKRKFTVGDITELAGVNRDAASRYIQALARVGLLTPLRREPGFAPTSNGHGRWLLTGDTGPKAPSVRRRGEVHDANTGTDHAPISRAGLRQGGRHDRSGDCPADPRRRAARLDRRTGDAGGPGRRQHEGDARGGDTARLLAQRRPRDPARQVQGVH
ncbi:hypothetical protein [Methylobrevis pamukkalensis]|uniref:hypothetical protein n=1 Tax=Methylobrevis pamukkalensis TaxID=1439726 RepID=UPI00114CD3F8|nr:hypothetical protein [Methylobrevis pamukkalensis]